MGVVCHLFLKALTSLFFLSQASSWRCSMIYHNHHTFFLLIYFYVYVVTCAMWMCVCGHVFQTVLFHYTHTHKQEHTAINYWHLYRMYRKLADRNRFPKDISDNRKSGRCLNYTESLVIYLFYITPFSTWPCSAEVKGLLFLFLHLLSSFLFT